MITGLRKQQAILRLPGSKALSEAAPVLIYGSKNTSLVFYDSLYDSPLIKPSGEMCRSVQGDR